MALTTGMLHVAMLASMMMNINAWHGVGHYSVAYIAQSYLIENDPEALEWANKLLEPFTDVCGENLYPFVESANWADKIGDTQWNIFYYHHFISHAWFAEGAKPYDFDIRPYANVVYGINEHTSQLASQSVDLYGSSKSILGKSIALRNIVHYLGDIHQPLHGSERITPSRPEGDKGGNLFLIDHYHNKSVDNLHFVWDHMFEPQHDDFRSNLPPEKYMAIKDIAESIMLEYPIESLNDKILHNSTPESWGLESNKIAQEFVYAGLTEGKDLPEEYQEKGRQICRERVALGGYRLGMLLSITYKKAFERKSIKS